MIKQQPCNSPIVMMNHSKQPISCTVATLPSWANHAIHQRQTSHVVKVGHSYNPAGTVKSCSEHGQLIQSKRKFVLHLCMGLLRWDRQNTLTVDVLLLQTLHARFWFWSFASV